LPICGAKLARDWKTELSECLDAIQSHMQQRSPLFVAGSHALCSIFSPDSTEPNEEEEEVETPVTENLSELWDFATEFRADDFAQADALSVSCEAWIWHKMDADLFDKDPTLSIPATLKPAAAADDDAAASAAAGTSDEVTEEAIQVYWVKTQPTLLHPLLRIFDERRVPRAASVRGRFTIEGGGAWSSGVAIPHADSARSVATIWWC
jgi:hypothetical protein